MLTNRHSGILAQKQTVYPDVTGIAIMRPQSRVDPEVVRAGCVGHTSSMSRSVTNPITHRTIILVHG